MKKTVIVAKNLAKWGQNSSVFQIDKTAQMEYTIIKDSKGAVGNTRSAYRFILLTKDLTGEY